MKGESGAGGLRLLGSAGFALFVAGVLVFTVLAANYHPEDPLLLSFPSSTITPFLTSTTRATFAPDETAARTGEDVIPNSDAAAAPVISIDDVSVVASGVPTECDAGAPVDCGDPVVFHAMMRAAIEQFPDVNFYRFGRPVRGDSDASCDMAWRYRPRDSRTAGFYKDYRRFLIDSGVNCTHKVISIGEYHTGINAGNKKKQNQQAELAAPTDQAVPVVGEPVNDSLPVADSESSFVAGKYLVYIGGGDRCKSMNHYLWSLLCALGEAQYLNRTLVMDLTICLSSIYTSSKQDEDGKDFRFYFDFEHLKRSASVLDQGQFWRNWARWHKKDGLSLRRVRDFRVTPMKLAGLEETLIVRKFGKVEPDNYWYRVCEGETAAVVQRPWHLIWKSPRLMNIVSGIASLMNWEFDSVHVVRGEKAKNTELWPNLAADTSPEALLMTLREKVEDGANLYMATNEADTAFFDPLKERYKLRFLDDFSELWREKSEWYEETKELNNGVVVEFDGYMRVEVDTEVFLRGRKQIETFNDLTADCKDGVNTCKPAS